MAVFVPQPVEDLRTLFNRVRGEGHVKIKDVQKRIHDRLQINWPYKEMMRFVNNQTKNPNKPIEDVLAISEFLKTEFNVLVFGRDTLEIPLNEGQKRLIGSGVVDMEALQTALMHEIERQVVALARGDTPAPATPKI